MELSEYDGLRIEDAPIRGSQTASAAEAGAHGTAELRTEWLILRRYRPEDADELYRGIGKDPEMDRYSGWNPYADPEMARQTVRRFLDSYRDARFYGWAIEYGDVLAGTIGAYDFENGRIEVGFSVIRAWWGRGFATEALKAVLAYLTESEGIPCVTAWCAAENAGSRRTLEKAGMRHVRTEKDGLTAAGKTYDRMIYEYRRENGAP